MTERRILDFNELEAWLRELPWWREWVRDIGGAVIGSSDGSGIHSSKPGSPTEREALNLIRIQDKVNLLDAWVGYMVGEDSTVTYRGGEPKLPQELAQLVHYRYMAKTAVMGLPVDVCCQALHISRPTFSKRREQALGLLVTAIYTSSIEMGPPYADCRPELVPPAARPGGIRAEISRLERIAGEWERRARGNDLKRDHKQAEWERQQATAFRERAATLRKVLEGDGDES